MQTRTQNRTRFFRKHRPPPNARGGDANPAGERDDAPGADGGGHGNAVLLEDRLVRAHVDGVRRDDADAHAPGPRGRDRVRDVRSNATRRPKSLAKAPARKGAAELREGSETRGYNR